MDGFVSKSVLLLDISRLIWRAGRRAPTGIDRVELAYAEHFLATTGGRPAYGVVHLFGFLFAVSPSGARSFVRALAARWSGSEPAALGGDLAAVVWIYLRLTVRVWLFGPWLRRALHAHPGGATFLVVSHHHVARGQMIERIRRGLRVKTACLIHDLIPIEYPEYFKPGWEQRYRRLSNNLGRHFDAVIANSEATASSLRTALTTESHLLSARTLVRVAALGARAFPQSQVSARVARERPYFVVLGTIEPRKNHLLLLNLWTRLLRATPVPPRLMVIGARGWENEQVVDMLERSRRLRGLVEEHGSLTDEEVGALLRDARALLLPSFAEGFGLPLAEALASGVPAICSNILPFREVGRDVPDYLDPLDLQAWLTAVLDYSRPHSVRRTAQIRRLAHWRAPQWDEHFAEVEQLLGDLGDPTRETTGGLRDSNPIEGILSGSP